MIEMENLDHVDFDVTRNCEVVLDLERFAPCDNGDFSNYSNMNCKLNLFK